MRSVAFVVVEPEADWPSWIIRRDVDIVAVVDSSEDEASDRVPLGSVRERVERVGRPLSLVVVACNTREGALAAAHRAAMAQTLLARIAASSERGHLVINASDRSSWRLRHELIGLCASLGDGVAGNARVSLRCGGIVRTLPAVRLAYPRMRVGPTRVRSAG